MAGIINSNIQLGDSDTASNNFTLTAEANDGSMKLARGNFGSTSQDLITLNATTVTLNYGQLEWPAVSTPIADANTIDEFKCRGAWIPKFTLDTPGTSTFGSYTIQDGFYTKIGNLVRATFFIRSGASSAGTGTGNLYVYGLPYTCHAVQWGSGTCVSNGFTTNGADGLVVNVSTTKTYPYYRSGAGYLNLTQANIATNMYIYGSITYFTTY